jgi:hypothetical protein
MEINDQTALREIQLVFSNFYPYLQLGFFRKGHDRYEVSSEGDTIEPDVTVGDIKKTHVSGLLEIQPSYTVADVEKEFMERFGLSVQVFRKEEDKWVQAMGMDDFSLRDLNEIGRNSSDDYILDDLEAGEEETEEKPEKLY